GPAPPGRCRPAPAPPRARPLGGGQRRADPGRGVRALRRGRGGPARGAQHRLPVRRAPLHPRRPDGGRHRGRPGLDQAGRLLRAAPAVDTGGGSGPRRVGSGAAGGPRCRSGGAPRPRPRQGRDRARDRHRRRARGGPGDRPRGRAGRAPGGHRRRPPGGDRLLRLRAGPAHGPHGRPVGRVHGSGGVVPDRLVPPGGGGAPLPGGPHRIRPAARLDLRGPRRAAVPGRLRSRARRPPGRARAGAPCTLGARAVPGRAGGGARRWPLPGDARRQRGGVAGAVAAAPRVRGDRPRRAVGRGRGCRQPHPRPLRRAV
ncbi:MAG: hypothetical protein AVDCRST_MAG20-2805, partial [uncultured Acidimicrobiales bacterium]